MFFFDIKKIILYDLYILGEDNMKITLLIAKTLLILTSTFIYSSFKLSSNLSREEYEEENN